MKMTDADERALDVLDRLVQDLGSITEDDAIGLQNYLRARLAADQQKGGDIGVGVDTTADGVHVCVRLGDTIVYSQMHLTPQPSIPAPAQRADEVHADALRIIDRDWFDYVDGPPAQQDGKASGGEAVDEMETVLREAQSLGTRINYSASHDEAVNLSADLRRLLRKALSIRIGLSIFRHPKWQVEHPPHADQEAQS